MKLGVLLLALQFLTQVGGGSPRAAELERLLLTRPQNQALYLELSREYERLGRSAQAEATLQNGLTQAADPRPVRAGLADFLARRDRWTEALATAASLEADPAGRRMVARLRVNAGLAAYREGDRRRARGEWERALANDPELVEAAVNLSALLLELGARDSARTVASAALVRHPDHARLLALHAATMEGPDGVAAAVTALRRLRTEQPGDERLGLELANLLAASGDRLSALALYDTLVRAPEASEAAHLAAATFWLDAERLDNAATILEQGTGKFPRSGTLLALLGEAEAGRGEWRKAITAYRRASRLLSRPEDAELPLLDVLVASGDTASALALASELNLRPAPRDVLLPTASLARTLGQAVLADSIYRTILARHPTDVEALEQAAALADGTGDPERATALYRLATEQDSSGSAAPLALLRLARPAPDSARLWLRRAVWRGMDALQALELQGAGMMSGSVSPRSIARARPVLDRQKQVRDLLRTALDTAVFQTTWGPDELEQLRLAYPQSALLERYAATLEAREGSNETALARYDRLLQRDATDAESQRARAQVLERMGRTRDAITGYTRTFDLTPEDEPTFRALQRLRQADGTLEALLEQIRRLRVRRPASLILGEHEVEVLHRLGRTAEAQEVARRLKEIKP